MRTIVAGLLCHVALAGPLAAAEPNLLTPEQIADGWISLFDGETLFGWTATSDANWKVEDGAITVSEGDEGFLATNAEFADFELQLELKCPKMANSGVFIRTPLEPTDPTKDCYEVNLAAMDNPFPFGSLVGRKKVEEEKLFRIGWGLEPNVGEGFLPLKIIAIGGRINVSFVGHPLLEYNDPKPIRRGRISLQFREGPVAFRNIRLKPLGLKPMLNGRDLTGWNTDRTEASTFEIVEGALGGRESFATGVSGSPNEPPVAKDSRPLPVLHVTSGPGQLETDALYGDFILQLQCRVDGDGLNSGIFFRSIPGDMMNGYESQIHNGFENGDPTQPTDAGTGAIFRCTTARRVVSRDHQWFAKTIIATGPHIAVWVDGYQVTDWTDQRPPHENPRKGRRTAPGTIIIQGHDPTTNLRFRDMRIVELPEKTNHEGTKGTKENTK